MMIVEKLRELFPDGEAGFITEEGGAICNGERMRWIIDPLDGTTNFIHGLPPYCVSIALMDGQEVVVGVVYEVTHSELFCAWQGSEAFLNGKPIRASKATKVDNALIAIGFSYAESARSQEWLDRIKTYQENSDGVRRLGSAAADAVYVACGRFDAFVQSGLAAWDIAAAALIVERAGARVSDFGGGSNYIFGGEFIAAAPLVYDEFMTTVR
jgi:myo-inositol-1(or 4)-monophosphatase